MVHCSVCVYVVNLVISKGCAAARAPVHKVLTLIDKSPLVQGHKYFPYSLGKALVHGKAFPCPVHRCTDLLKLLCDDGMVLFLYFPCALDEFLTAQVMLCLALFHKALLNYVLSCNAGMVGSRNPQCRDTFHSIVTDKDILK